MQQNDRETIIQDARELYRSGMSTREIGIVFGVWGSTVYHWVKDIARDHRRKDSTHWRTNRQRARKTIEAHLGRTLASDEHVHHINRDFTDNRIENLQVLTAEDHAHEHHGFSDPDGSRKYYLANKERLDAYHQEWRKKNPEKVAAIRAKEEVSRRQFPHTCANCGKEYSGLKHSKFCSRDCGWQGQSKLKDHIQEIVAMRQAGESLSSIAERFGVTHQAVLHHLKRHRGAESRGTDLKEVAP